MKDNDQHKLFQLYTESTTNPGTKSDREKMDLDDDGELEPYEKKRGNAIRSSQNKEHICAKKVQHEKFGAGDCVHSEHAEPDENGYVGWYTVQFEHGQELVNTVDVQVVDEMSHKH